MVELLNGNYAVINAEEVSISTTVENCQSVSLSNSSVISNIQQSACIVVVARFTFFPFSKVDGVIQPLIFNIKTAFPPRINLVPFIYWFDYETKREALLNLIGNITMFIPLGIVWPSVFPRLDSHIKVLLSGFGCSLCIEMLQLPFYDRVSDVDDLILNTFGFAVGYGIFLLFGLIFGTKNRT